MSKSLWAKIAIGVGTACALLASPPVHAEVTGGYINSINQRALVRVHGNMYSALFAMSAAPFRMTAPSGSVPQLYVVAPGGRWRTATSVNDRHGIRIVAPSARSTSSKLVYVDDAGYVIGGVGLSSDEISNIVAVYGLTEGADLATFAATGAQTNFFSAVSSAGDSVRNSSGTDYQRSDAFVRSVGMLAGRAAQNLLDGMRTAAYVNDRSSGFSDAHLNVYGESLPTSGTALWTGAAVAFGDNGGGGGGKGIVAFGDNGGGGGGKGLVAFGDNGGGGGGKGLVSCPSDIMANFSGALVFIDPDKP